jgi:hypothetical protein
MPYDAKEFAEKRIFPLFMKAEPFGKYCDKARDVISQVMVNYISLGSSGRWKSAPGFVLKGMENVFDFCADDVSCLAEEAALVGFEMGAELKKSATPYLEFERIMARVVELGGGDVIAYKTENRENGKLESWKLKGEESSQN